MSDIDLTEAIEAGIEVRWPDIQGDARDVAAGIIRDTLMAALPFLTAQVREQIARDINALLRESSDHNYRRGVRDARSIVRDR